MSSSWAPGVSDLSQTYCKSFSANLAQAAATYDIATASGGDILMLDAVVYISVAAADLVSVSVQTNDTTAVTIMSAAEGAVANLTGGKNAKVFATATVLASTKKLQFTIVGTGTAGTMKVVVQYRKTAAGADLV